MTENNPESAPATEPVVPPSTAPSEPAVSPPSGSPDVGDLVKSILKHPDFQKATQSVKDKRIAEIQTSLEEQGGDLARLAAALNVDPKDLQAAQAKIAVEDMVKAYQDGKLGQAQVPETQPQGSGVDLAKARQSIITQTGLPDTHPGFDDYLAKLDWSDPVAATLSATAWATEQKATIKQPTAADTAPQSGGIAPTTLDAMTEDELGAKLITLQKDPAKNAKERKEVLDALKRKAAK